MPKLTVIICAFLSASSLYATSLASSPSPNERARGALASVQTTKIVCLGDSVTEGYGLSKEEAFPALLQKALSTPKRPVEVVNAGISGSTSASGPARIKWLLKAKPTLVLIELGANDGLRGQDPDATKKNLSLMIDEAKKAGVKTVLVAMKLPPNFGKSYRQAFGRIFSDVAKEKNIPLIPFLDDFFAAKGLLQADGLHPNAKGHQLVAEKLAKILEPLL